MSEEQNNNKEEQKIKRGKNFDVFISYRRSDGTDKAKQLDLAFSIDDCRTFFDFKSLGTGAFDKRLENAVLDAPIFIMVWTPDYFKRCVKGGETADGKTVLEPDEDDWVRKEIELALKHNKKIIPINFNHVLDKVPDYLDDEFRNKISPHNYVNLYGDNTFDATVKHIFDKEIRPFIGATPKPENKVKVRVKADADCELIDNDEVIATIQQGKTAQLFFERGEYELIARSTEFSDIENVIERTFDDVSFSYFVKTELAYRVKQRRIQIEEEEKKKREEEERLRREEEERIRREEEERRRREEEQRLAEQRKKEEEQRRKEEQARLEAEKAEQKRLERLKRYAEKTSPGKEFDIFICYRRSDGSDKARILNSYFKEKGFRTFLDYDSLTGERFDERIEQAIKDSSVFIMVLTPDFFARCNQEGDWVRKEIDVALRSNKIIIPIDFNGNFIGFPDYLDEHFKMLIGAHCFERVYMDSTFEPCMEHLLDRRIRPYILREEKTLSSTEQARLENQKQKTENGNQVLKVILQGIFFFVLPFFILFLCIANCEGFGGATITTTETAAEEYYGVETPAEEVELPAGYPENEDRYCTETEMVIGIGREVEAEIPADWY